MEEDSDKTSPSGLVGCAAYVTSFSPHSHLNWAAFAVSYKESKLRDIHQERQRIGSVGVKAVPVCDERVRLRQ